MDFCFVYIQSRIRVENADTGELDQTQCGNSARNVSRNKNKDPRLKNDQLENFRQLYIKSRPGDVRKEFSYFFTCKKNTEAYRYLVLLKNVICYTG